MLKIATPSQEAADSTFYGQQLQQQAREKGGGAREGGGVAPLQERLSALQDMTEEERGVALKDKRLSEQVSIPTHRLSTTTTL